MSVTILRADARALPLPDASVDLVVTSPPYFGLRDYEDDDGYDEQIGAETDPIEFVNALVDCTREMVRVLAPTGSLWVNLGDKYASYEGNRGDGRHQTNDRRPVYPTGSGLAGGGLVRNKSLMGLPWRYALACLDRLNLILRAEVVWAKQTGMPESVTDRVRRAHETWFHFTVRDRYYANLDPIREPHTWTPSPGYKGHQRTARGGVQPDHTFNGAGAPGTQDERGKIPGSVRTVTTVPLVPPPHLGVKHHAAFPPEWPRWIIDGWCPPGGTVLDPFGGTGTTAMVADVMGRTAIHVDRSAAYCRLARWRTSDPDQRGRVNPTMEGLW